MLERFEPAHAAKVKSHFANLCQLALADAFVTKEELDYLNKLCNGFNLDKADLDYIMDNAYTIPFHAPKTSMERLEQIYDLVRMVLIDNPIDERKVLLCVQVAEKLGFKAHIVGDLIKALVNVTEETGEDSLRENDLQLILKEG
jgi:Zn-finger nucleic acid-binding protein